MKKILIALFIVVSVNAQNWQEIRTIFNPTGVEMKKFTAPVFYDIDDDGMQDMLLCYLSSNAKLYINKSDSSAIRFIEDTVYLKQIKLLDPTNNYTYAVWVDLNGDGTPDLVTGGFKGFTAFYNLGTYEAPQWVKKDSVFLNVNPLIGTDPKPEFGDLDGDGDFDLLAGIGESILGGPEPGITLGFRNVGSATNPVFESYPAFVNGIADAGRNSYPALADLDGDGDLDLLLGRDLSSFMYYRNTGTVNAPAWTYVNQYIVTETSHYWKNPAFVDFDNDGDLDLIYGTDEGNILSYQNNGTSSQPLYQYNGSWFRVIKVNGMSTISLADYDHDGDLDLLTGTVLGGARLIRNDGTRTEPNFELTPGNFGNMSVGSAAYPSFVDFNNDGAYDVVTGARDGMVYLYLNTNGSYSTANWFYGIDVGWTSTPTAADLDGDGDIDLLIGAETAADVTFLENTGNNNFVKNQSFITGINFGSYNRLAFGDVDNDGDYDLLIGNLFGDLKFYRNIGTPTQPAWQEESSLLAGIPKRDQNSSPGIGDIDGDTRPDLLIGDGDGNFVVYKNLFAPVSVKEPVEVPGDFTVSAAYPNPFNGSTRFEYFTGKDGIVTVKLMNTIGQVLFAEKITGSNPGRNFYDLDPGKFGLSSGVYFVSFERGGKSDVKKIIYLK
ncbi:MAG: hypothetical protein B6D45_08695 [Ignavibacteriales bacterium UTCHB3]|nr:MAG: hypothetical protein B6D45_08695 [Ignavibacteriales bacterium UTCHB3]